jgi:hypothetical protein
MHQEPTLLLREFLSPLRPIDRPWLARAFMPFTLAILHWGIYNIPSDFGELALDSSAVSKSASEVSTILVCTPMLADRRDAGRRLDSRLKKIELVRSRARGATCAA